MSVTKHTSTAPVYPKVAGPTGATGAAGAAGAALVTAPATAASTGVLGQFATDGTSFFVCTATNTWVKAPLALATW